MGARISIHQMSNVQLQSHIRRLAQDSGSVYFLDHARLRMQERSINDLQVLECLRTGVVQRPPRRFKTGELRVRMDHFGSARNLSVMVSLDEQDPDVLVVTVMTRTR